MTKRPPIRALFTAAIFFSSFQLFLVQPMSAKMLLPHMGGSASVWTTCMVFFQATLLAGYLYAWFMQRKVSLRTQLIVHAVLTLSTFAFIPFALRMPPFESTSAPLFWIILTLLGTVGLPFFLTSTSSPLLQSWFANTDHPDAHDPYFLYAASNLGSMLALFGYLLVLEPALALGDRTLVWASGHTLYVVALGVIMLAIMRPLARAATDASDASEGAEASSEAPSEEAPAPTPKQMGLWVLYAAIPSSMLVGATHHLTVDVAPIPLLWVVPLALYLGSFIVVFARRQPLSKKAWRAIGWFLLMPMSLLTAASHVPTVAGSVALLGLFVTSIVFHGRMAELRPAASHLTLFYAMMSLGGMLGGMFNGLVAPLVFDLFLEYYLVCFLTLLVWPRVFYAELRAWPKAALVGVAAYLIVVAMLTLDLTEAIDPSDVPIFLGLIGALGYILIKRPIIAHLFVVVIVAAMAIPKLELNDDDRLLSARSFYGSLVLRRSGPDKDVIVLVNGDTIHGAQTRGSLTALSYHWPGGPAGDILGAASPDARVGIIGLGVGALCGYYKPGQRYDFFEIDPLVIEVASDPEYFTYLQHCGEAGMYVGDGRLELAKHPEGSYDIIVLDAFSSDAIPTHLLTDEAVGLYEDRLAEGGLLLFHVSNRYLNLTKVISVLATHRGLNARVRKDPTDLRETLEATSSIWIALSRDPARIEAIDAIPGWEPMPDAEHVGLWTDDHTNILDIFEFQRTSKGKKSPKNEPSPEDAPAKP